MSFLRTGSQASSSRECRALPLDDEGYEAVPADAEEVVTKRKSGRSVKRALTSDSDFARQEGFGYDDFEGQDSPVQELISEATTWQEVCRRIVINYRFQAAMGVLIIANAAVIGLETDNADWEHWDLIENTFLFLFSCELALKLMGFGIAGYFDWTSGDFNWNLFDFGIVSLGLVDVTFSLIGGHGHGGVATIFRIIRLLRILRIFRIVKFLKELYVLAFGFALAAVAMFWVTFLMLFVLYVCSIILVRTSGQPSLEDPDYKFLVGHFGNIRVSMLTLFELMTSPNLTEYRHVIEPRPVLALFLVIFIIFGSFGLVALLTGVISETMFEKNALRLEEERRKRELNRKNLIRAVHDCFDTLPVNEYGEALRDDIEKLLPTFTKTFEKLSVEFNEADLEAMIKALVHDSEGHVSREEFRRCIVQMAEGLSPLQIMELYQKANVVERSFKNCDAIVEDVMQHDRDQSRERIDSVIEELARRVQSISGSMQALHKRVDAIDDQFEQQLLDQKEEIRQAQLQMEEIREAKALAPRPSVTSLISTTANFASGRKSGSSLNVAGGSGPAQRQGASSNRFARAASPGSTGSRRSSVVSLE